MKYQMHKNNRKREPYFYNKYSEPENGLEKYWYFSRRIGATTTKLWIKV